MPFRKILVGLDGSPQQPHVLAQAVELADRCCGTLVLCRSMQVPLSIPALAWTLKGGDFANFLQEHGKEALSRLRNELTEGLVSDVICRIGQPANVICDVAQELGAKLIVIGSHGYDNIDRLLGTTAAKVTNRAHCSVMIVRTEA